MSITKDQVVLIHYTLKNDNGDTIDSSQGKEPLGFIYGTGAIIRGLETALESKREGDTFSVSIPPESAYGNRRDDMIQTVPITQFDDPSVVEVGAQFQIPEQNLIAVVTACDKDNVTLDLNHPLADQTLHFDVDVVTVRDASAEELEHGRVHAESGHKHD